MSLDIASTKILILQTLAMFDDRLVTDENLFAAVRVKASPALLFHSAVATCLREMEAAGSVLGQPDALGRPTWKLTAAGKALLAEILP